MAYTYNPLKIEHLRIGNIIADKGKPCRVHISELQEIQADNKNYTGIELTPEILEKCGFKVFEESSLITAATRPDLSTNIYTNTETKQTYFHQGEKMVDIKYLHQLQNLYFALTGEELMIEKLLITG